MFEAAEKKIELIVRGGGLRRRPFDFWQTVVDRAGARVLSKMSSAESDAYVLSESSLFVWDRRLTLLTCGRTNLIPSVEFLFQEFDPQNVDAFFYERKNEAYPHLQSTTFAADEAALKRLMPGRSRHFGDPNGHHLHLFQKDGLYRPNERDGKFEVLMYGSTAFAGARSREDFRASGEIFGGFQIDDHCFDPRGYSLNALRGSEYYTLHLTPGEPSYLSFEGNVGGLNRAPLIREILETFQPASYDIVDFIPKPQGFEVQYTTSNRMPLDLGSDQGEHHLQWSKI